MATDDRGSRIFSDLNVAFSKDPLIDEYGVIPVLEPKKNKSPLLLVDHKLGLELWSVKILYEYCYNALLSWRKKQTSFKQIGCEELNNLSRAVLLINPELSTAWNIRKELVSAGELRISDDLKLGGIILTKQPKSPETFSHRKWLLNRLKREKKIDVRPEPPDKEECVRGAVNNGVVSIDYIDVDIVTCHNTQSNNHTSQEHPANYLPLFSQELKVCDRAASQYPSNYYAWTHRIWVIQTCYCSSILVCVAELSNTADWVSTHVSDHSGFHFRQFLLSTLVRRKDELHTETGLSLHELIQKERKLVTGLIHQFPGHESLWYHRRFVFQTSVKCSDMAPVSKYSNSSANGLTKGLHSEERESGNRCGLKKSRLENDILMKCAKEVDCINQTEILADNSHQQKLALCYVEWIKTVFL